MAKKFVVTGGGDSVTPPGSAHVEIDGVSYAPGDEIPEKARVAKWLLEQGYVAEVGKTAEKPAPEPEAEPEPITTDEEV